MRPMRGDACTMRGERGESVERRAVGESFGESSLLAEPRALALESSLLRGQRE